MIRFTDLILDSITFKNVHYRLAVLLAVFLTLITPLIADAQFDPHRNPIPPKANNPERDKRIFDKQVAKGNTRVDPPNPWEFGPPLANRGFEWFGAGVVDEDTLAAMRSKFKPLEYDVTSNKAFLEQAGTGIFRLLPGRKCVVGGFFVLTIADCEGYAVEGSAYSFRSATNTESESSDIRLGLNGELHLDGFANNSLVTSVNVPLLKDVTHDRAELKYLREYQPAEDVEGFRTQLENANAIIKANGYHYSRSAKAVVGVNYVARIIAYKLDLPDSSWETRHLGRSRYISRQFKKGDRIDTLIAFSIVRKSEDGGFTILWKELERKKTTTLKVSKKSTFDQIFFR